MSKPEVIRPISAGGNGINMLLYSYPGVGKTPLIGTGKNTLIFDADAGADSALLAGSTAEVWPVEAHTDLYEGLDYLKHEKHSFKWAWLDGITIYQEKGLEEVMSDLVVTKTHRDIDLPDRGEFRLNYGRILRWTRHMAALDINFGITAHVMNDNWDSEMMVPYIAGKAENGAIWSKVCGYMGIVAYLRTGQNEKRGKHWVLHTEKYQQTKQTVFYAKDRYGALGTLREPTIPKIEALVASKLESAAPSRPTSAGRKRKTTSASTKKRKKRR